MRETIDIGNFVIQPWPDGDGDMEIKYTNDDDDLDTYWNTGWVSRNVVLILIKALIRNFNITEDELQ